MLNPRSLRYRWFILTKKLKALLIFFLWPYFRILDITRIYARYLTVEYSYIHTHIYIHVYLCAFACTSNNNQSDMVCAKNDAYHLHKFSLANIKNALITTCHETCNRVQWRKSFIYSHNTGNYEYLVSSGDINSILQKGKMTNLHWQLEWI